MKKCWKYLALMLFLPLLMGGTVQVGTGPTKTTGTMSKTIGATGDYATFALAMAAVPDLLANSVTLTIQAGTTLSETCYIRNKHATTSSGSLSVKSARYFPTSGALPTADSATATTLRDADLATAALGDDYFVSCWVFIVHGTGTDNGFVAITDYVDATGDVVVAAWPGTQPDNTSRYVIVGALIDCLGTQDYGLYIGANTVATQFTGIGVTGANNRGIYATGCSGTISFYYCGVYDSDLMGIYILNGTQTLIYYSGIVKNNTDNTAGYSGIYISGVSYCDVAYCGISDNNRYGCISTYNAFANMVSNFGDANGTYGTYAQYSAQARCTGTECSGSSGNHSNGSGDGSLAY